MLRDTLLNLTRQLYPTGRIFKLGAGFDITKLHYALTNASSTFISDSKSTLDSAIPDNANFTVDDATAWERRLGIIQGSSILADRKDAIIRKMNFPNSQLARQNWRWLEYQLQLANFGVFVHENRFPDGFGGFITKTLLEVDPFGDFLDDVECGNAEYGQYEFGGLLNNLVINYLEESKDAQFITDNSLRTSFFVGGAVLGDYANVPIAQKKQFRELIIKIKPLQEIGFLLINYV